MFATHAKVKTIARLLKWLFVLTLMLLLGSIAFFSVHPDLGRLKRVNPSKTAFMEYREQEWKSEGKRIKIDKKWVRFSSISPYVIKAAIIAEDDKFWKHRGFDYDAIEKAIEKDLQHGSFKFGGSTISQQLVKNLYLSPSKNPFRKGIEAFLTWRMERTISKKRILELYLNVVEWGEGIFGVEAASLHYYGKPSSLLTGQEASHLVAVLPNPRKYLVNGNSRYVERRARLIYHIMAKRGIVVKEYEEAVKEHDASRFPPKNGESIKEDTLNN
jgi:monofunctional glycosyltransferase